MSIVSFPATHPGGSASGDRKIKLPMKCELERKKWPQNKFSLKIDRFYIKKSSEVSQACLHGANFTICVALSLEISETYGCSRYMTSTPVGLMRMRRSTVARNWMGESKCCCRNVSSYQVFCALVL